MKVFIDNQEVTEFTPGDEYYRVRYSEIMCSYEKIKMSDDEGNFTLVDLNNKIGGVLGDDERLFTTLELARKWAMDYLYKRDKEKSIKKSIEKTDKKKPTISKGRRKRTVGVWSYHPKGEPNDALTDFYYYGKDD